MVTLILTLTVNQNANLDPSPNLQVKLVLVYTQVLLDVHLPELLPVRNLSSIVFQNIVQQYLWVRVKGLRFRVTV